MLSGIIITKNEELMISDCLASLNFVDEIILVDTGNTDQTNTIAKKYNAKIVHSSGSDYSQFRNDGLKHASGTWIIYVDADERISSDLKQEILNLISTPATAVAYDIPRKNIYLGQEMKYGGWGNDSVIRLFKKDSLQGYVNRLHEQPSYTGQLAKLRGHLIHYSHRDLSSMLNKTLSFTEYEASLRFQSHHPPVVWWRFIRIMLTEYWIRFIKLSAWRDGTRGVIDGIFQVFNSFVIYAKLWEMQQPESSDKS